MLPLSSRSLAVLATLLAVAGCDSSTEPEPLDPGATLTVDASSPSAWILVDLATPAQTIAVTDPAASTAWDLGFQTSKIMLNGGASGPAGMVGYCLCQNGNPTAEVIQTLTAEQELPDFEAVTAAQIPASGASWTADVFTQSPWYKYNVAGEHQIWPTFNVYLVKRGTEVYKVQVTGYYGPTGATRQITFRYARLTT